VGVTAGSAFAASVVAGALLCCCCSGASLGVDSLASMAWASTSSCLSRRDCTPRSTSLTARSTAVKRACMLPACDS
jgi:hypothetical protein